MTVPINEELEQFRGVDRADVYKAGQRAATLTPYSARGKVSLRDGRTIRSPGLPQ